MRQNLISMFNYANQPEKAKFSVLKSRGLDWAYQGKIDDVSENTTTKLRKEKSNVRNRLCVFALYIAAIINVKAAMTLILFSYFSCVIYLYYASSHPKPNRRSVTNPVS